MNEMACNRCGSGYFAVQVSEESEVMKLVCKICGKEFLVKKVNGQDYLGLHLGE